MRVAPANPLSVIVPSIYFYHERSHQMTVPNILFNNAGRLRSGWRLAIFFAVYYIVLAFLIAMLFATLPLVLGSTERADALLASGWGFVVQSLIILTTATLLGWLCGRVIEDLPWRALGWKFHRGWLRDLGLGSLVGALSLVLAVAIALAVGGFGFAASGWAAWPLILKTLVGAGLIFVVAAAAEEALFRGYPLQTVLRSWPAWLALVPTSIMFAGVHLANPNVARGYTFVNTALAGVWLAVAYLRTRSLWFPLGVHWAWNWTMGALLGLPVSGITSITPAPLLRATDHGPAWLTGGAYGIEGGLACTLALILSTLFIWRTKLLKADAELKQLTDAEIPNPPTGPITIRE